MFLLIENPGVAPIEAYTLLGMSTSRTSGKAGTIGQFGSGSKHAINTLLRLGNELVIFCGTTQLTFGTKSKPVTDACGNTTDVEVVVCTITDGDRRKKPTEVELGFSKEFGAMDWQQLPMALREFVSNAIDCTIAKGLDVADSIEDATLRVSLVEQNQLAGRAGTTRVFVATCPAVFDYFGNLGRHFLHFNHGQWSGRIEGSINDALLPKPNPPKSPPTGDFGEVKDDHLLPQIYREGVFVRRIEGFPSLFNYNFTSDQIKIDESRNSNDHTVRNAAAKIIRKLPAEDLAALLLRLEEFPETFEAMLDSWELGGNTYATNSPEELLAWQRAWKIAFGEKGVAVNREAITVDTLAMAKDKGYTPHLMPPTWYTAIQKHKCPTIVGILTQMENRGMREEPATPAAEAALDWVWNCITYAGMDNNKEKPPIKCFTSTGNANKTEHGLCTGDGIFIATEIAENEGSYLKQVVLEEVVHWVTGSIDGSRDMQNYVIKLFVDMMKALGTPV